MTLKLKQIANLLWKKHSHSQYFSGPCSICGGDYIPMMDQQDFDNLIDEIDCWIEENYAKP